MRGMKSYKEASYEELLLSGPLAVHFDWCSQENIYDKMNTIIL